MLTIRNEQMQALRTVRMQQLHRLVSAHVQAHLPSWADDVPGLTTQVRRGVARGLRHFSAPDDLARYAEIVLRHLGGWTDEDHPAAALEMIHSQSLPAARRLDNFERWAKTRGAARAD